MKPLVIYGTAMFILTTITVIMTIYAIHQPLNFDQKFIIGLVMFLGYTTTGISFYINSLDNKNKTKKLFNELKTK